MFHKGASGKMFANPQQMKHMDGKSKQRGNPEPIKDEPDIIGKDPAETSDVGTHLEQLHEKMGGKHMHVHQGEDGAITTHQVGEDGMVEGPHTHGSAEEAGEHMHGFMGGGAEMGADPHEGGAMPGGGMKALMGY